MKYYLLFLVSITSLISRGTHLLGGDLTYNCIGNHNYEIVLTVYRDCFGTNLQSPTQGIQIKSSCDTVLASLNQIDLNPTDPNSYAAKDTSLLCNAYLNNTTCDLGGIYPGIEIMQWRGTVTLPPCTDWELSWNYAARSPGFEYPFPNDCGKDFLNTYLTNIYISKGILNLLSHINNVDSLCNGSPDFKTTPNFLVCQGQETVIDQVGIDPDGDSLSYKLIAYYNTASIFDTMQYILGYSSQNPISTMPGTSFSIDNYTGEIKFTPQHFGLACGNPDTIEVSHLTMIVSQHRNGILAGTSMRDYLFMTLPNCKKFTPTYQGFIQLGNQTFLQNDTIKVHANDTLDFTVQIMDLASSDSFVLANTLEKEIPSISFSSFSLSPPNIMNGQTRLITDTSQIGIYKYNIIAKNNSCPLKIEVPFPLILEILPTDTTSTSIAKDLESSVKIFPNPTNGKLNIELNEMTNNANISIIDITGKELFHKKIHTNKTSMDLNVPSGVYFVRIATDKQTEVKKIIVE